MQLRLKFARDTAWGRALAEAGAALLHLLLPTPCRLCGGPLGPGRHSVVCRACWAGLPSIAEGGCPCCGKPYGGPAGPNASPANACGDCRAAPPPFLLARACLHYRDEGGGRPLVLAMKYGGRPGLAEALGRRMADEAPVRLGQGTFDLVVPVPLGRARLRERGFNQAALLARPIAGRAGVALDERSLRRARPTPPQAGSPAARAANVRDAFALARRARVAGRRVLLVDDVFTTGATARECARTLLAGGAASVAVYTLARAE
jgi:ComF family protein